MNSLPNSEFDAKQYLKDHKIPFKNCDRIEILGKVLPFMECFMEKQTVETLRSMSFISSRALAEIVRLCAQLSEVNDTICNIQLYIKDSFDDEVKHIAISASKKTANEILHKMGYSQGGDEEEVCESDDSQDGMYTEEECEDEEEDDEQTSTEDDE